MQKNACSKIFPFTPSWTNRGFVGGEHKSERKRCTRELARNRPICSSCPSEKRKHHEVLKSVWSLVSSCNSCRKPLGPGRPISLHHLLFHVCDVAFLPCYRGVLVSVVAVWVVCLGSYESASCLICQEQNLETNPGWFIEARFSIACFSSNWLSLTRRTRILLILECAIEKSNDHWLAYRNTALIEEKCS